MASFSLTLKTIFDLRLESKGNIPPFSKTNPCIKKSFNFASFAKKKHSNKLLLISFFWSATFNQIFLIIYYLQK